MICAIMEDNTDNQNILSVKETEQHTAVDEHKDLPEVEINKENEIETTNENGGASNELSTDLQVNVHAQSVSGQQQLRADYEVRLEQLRVSLEQKNNMIELLQREHRLLEKEKQTYCREMEMAKKEKESTVIKFAMQEKLVIDARREKEIVEKQLADAKRKLDNNAIALQAFGEEKTRLASVIDRKCQEMQVKLREFQKLKTDYNYMESKYKYTSNKLNMEIEARSALEKKMEEQSGKLEEKTIDQVKVEYSAKSILLTHELERKSEALNNLKNDLTKLKESEQMFKDEVLKYNEENTQLTLKLQQLQQDYNNIQCAYSDELFKTSTLRGQLEDLQLLRTQNMLNSEKLEEVEGIRDTLLESLQEARESINLMHKKQQELLDINKQMSESIADLQNDNSLVKSKLQAVETEIDIIRREKTAISMELTEVAEKLNHEEEIIKRDRNLLARLLSEKTKLYETTKIKLETLMSNFEANQNKHSTIVKELKREIRKNKRLTANGVTDNAAGTQGPQIFESEEERQNGQSIEDSSISSSISCSDKVMRASVSGETLKESDCGSNRQQEIKVVSKKHLVERVLRLQQLTTRQAEKIEFLENHTLSLVSELQKKSRLLQYYTLRDHSGALTFSKSDQNSDFISKYGNGVLPDFKANMTLELSLEMNKKLQAVLDDTLLRNITLKENVDVLGLEVDNLSKKLRDSKNNASTNTHS